MDFGEITYENLKKQGISGFSNGNFIENLGKEKIDSLKNSVKEIQKLVDEREMLSDNFIAEGDEIKLEIGNFLLENEKFSKNVNEKDFLTEKNSLRNKKIEISELQMKEKIDCWKDIALLKKELRMNEKELSEKQTRLDELNEILKEN